jgi:hypothetical protein
MKLRQRTVVAFAVAVCGSCWSAGAGWAQEPGVHVDPSSPAGREYAIPLDSTRSDYTPTPQKKRTTTTPTTRRSVAPRTTTTVEQAPSRPRFGEGVTSQPTVHRARPKSKPHARRPHQRPRPDAASPAPRPPASVPLADTSSTVPTTVVTAAVVGAVMLLALTLAAALRLRRRRTA